MKLEKGPMPLYFQLERILRSRIAAGEFPLGGRLPTELELCEEYGVSRATARKAISSLELDGIIKREQGRGTTLIPRDKNKIVFRLHSAFDEFLQAGKDTGLKLFSKTVVTPDEEVRKDMNLNDRETVFLFEGVRTVSRQERVLSYLKAHVPRSIGAKISIKKEKDNPFLIRRVTAVASESVWRVRQVVRPGLTNEHVAAVLGVEAGTPALIIKRLYLTRENRVLQRSLSFQAGGGAELESEIHLSTRDPL